MSESDQTQKVVDLVPDHVDLIVKQIGAAFPDEKAIQELLWRKVRRGVDEFLLTPAVRKPRAKKRRVVVAGDNWESIDSVLIGEAADSVHEQIESDENKMQLIVEEKAEPAYDPADDDQQELPGTNGDAA